MVVVVWVDVDVEVFFFSLSVVVCGCSGSGWWQRWWVDVVVVVWVVDAVAGNVGLRKRETEREKE